MSRFLPRCAFSAGRICRAGNSSCPKIMEKRRLLDLTSARYLSMHATNAMAFLCLSRMSYPPGKANLLRDARTPFPLLQWVSDSAWPNPSALWFSQPSTGTWEEYRAGNGIPPPPPRIYPMHRISWAGT